MTSNPSNSSQALFFIRATVLAAIVLGIVASLASAQAGQDKNGLRIAVVNPGKLLTEYKYAKASTEALEKIDGEAKQAISTWGRYPLLNVADQDALVKLVQKENTPGVELTKAEKDQEQALKTKHDNLVKEFNDLLGKPNGQTTAQDSARLDALNRLKIDTESRIKDKQTTATAEIGKRQDEYNQKIDKDVRDALNKVAKDKSMNLVFSSQVLLYADSDITDDVIKHLNANNNPNNK
jgi:Skp family chaperone for outer membrane proteins